MAFAGDIHFEGAARGALGFDAVSMANNHAVDFGDDVLAQTLRAKEHSLVPIAGIGGNAAAAFAPVDVRLGAVRLAVLASSQVRDLASLY